MPVVGRTKEVMIELGVNNAGETVDEGVGVADEEFIVEVGGGFVEAEVGADDDDDEEFVVALPWFSSSHLVAIFEPVTPPTTANATISTTISATKHNSLLLQPFPSFTTTAGSINSPSACLP